MKTTRDKIIDALGAAEDSGWGTVGKYSKQLISVAANELLMMGGRTVIGGIIIDQAVEIDSLRAQLAEANKERDRFHLELHEKGERLLTLTAQNERLREDLRDAAMFIEASYIDWARMNNDSPDHDPNYKPEFPEVVHRCNAILKSCTHNSAKKEGLI